MARISEVHIGSRFGRLVVRELFSAPNSRPGRSGMESMASCVCRCGNKWVGPVDKLGGNTKSCGCLHLDKITKHGLSKRNPRLYFIWKNMVDRCTKENNAAYRNYGAMDVSVCEQWLKSAEVFEKWALESGYSSMLTIDRKNPCGNYSPDNCRWIILKEQPGNCRRRRMYKAWGESKSASDWLSDTRCKVKNRRLIRQRIFTLGWTVERAMSVVVDKQL